MDRIGRRPVIAVGLVGSESSFLSMDFVTKLPALCIARGLSRALYAAVLLAVLTYVAEASNAPNRPRKFAFIASATTLAVLLGPGIGSWLSPMVLTLFATTSIGDILITDSPFFSVALITLVSATIPIFCHLANRWDIAIQSRRATTRPSLMGP